METLVESNPVLLCGDEIKAIYEALASSGHHSLAALIATKCKRSESDLKFISALADLDHGEFDVDDHPVVSASHEGAYVMVWRWISNDDANLNFDEKSNSEKRKKGDGTRRVP